MRPLGPLLLALLLSSGGCGEAAVGGGGRLRAPLSDGGPLQVEVEGRPYEMGWWQGRLLRDPIRGLHPRWQDEAFGGGARARILRSACLVYVEQTLQRMPEDLRQELDGLADGCGLPAADLLLTAVLRDGLRYHAVPPRLTATLLWEAVGPRLTCVPRGPDGAILAREGILLTRRPSRDGTVSTTLLTWPGSLGGVAGFAEGGWAVVLAEAERPLEEQTLSAVPFTVRLRQALEGARSRQELLEGLAPATAHRVLGALPPEGPGGEQASGPGGPAVFVRTGHAALEAAYVADMAEAAWRAEDDDPEGWSPEGVWLGPARRDAVLPPAGAAWRVGWGAGGWHLEVVGASASATR